MLYRFLFTWTSTRARSILNLVPAVLSLLVDARTVSLDSVHENIHTRVHTRTDRPVREYTSTRERHPLGSLFDVSE